MTPEDFVHTCQRNNVRIQEIQPSAGYLALIKTFRPGDKEAYVMAESDVGIIYETPSVGAGSVWGTDGGSVGGMVGLNGGYMVLKKSNVSKRWLAKVQRLVQQ